MKIVANFLGASRHRNGVCGAPFHVTLFDKVEDGKVERMIGLVFDDPTVVAVLRVADIVVDALAGAVVALGNGKYRGDNFEDELRAGVKKADAAFDAAFKAGLPKPKKG